MSAELCGVVHGFSTSGAPGPSAKRRTCVRKKAHEGLCRSTFEPESPVSAKLVCQTWESREGRYYAQRGTLTVTSVNRAHPKYPATDPKILPKEWKPGQESEGAE